MDDTTKLAYEGRGEGGGGRGRAGGGWDKKVIILIMRMNFIDDSKNVLRMSFKYIENMFWKC